MAECPVAFYGSLRQAYPTLETLRLRHRLRYLGPALLEGRLIDLGPYPGLLPGPGSVTAELHLALDEQVLDLLDDYEGFQPAAPAASPFIRQWHRLVHPARAAWVYFLSPAHVPANAPVIPSGDWLHHRPPLPGSRPPS